jgi:hypothetical protein
MRIHTFVVQIKVPKETTVKEVRRRVKEALLRSAFRRVTVRREFINSGDGLIHKGKGYKQ